MIQLQLFKKILFPGLLCLAGGYSFSARATCSLTAPTAPYNNTASMIHNAISVGEDLPNGTIIYQQKVVPYVAANNRVEVTCTEWTTSWLWENKILSSTYGLSSWSTGEFAGKVYATNVAGIGVAFKDGYGKVIPSSSDESCTNGATGGTTKNCYFKTGPGNMVAYTMYLIKTGAIQQGTLNGAQLPVIEMKFGQKPSTQTVQVLRSAFSSSIAITRPTCTTPDFSVDLGTWDVYKDFANVGNVTEWRDASIKLTGCGTFRGTAPGANVESIGGGTSTKAALTANGWRIKIDPVQTLDAANGILDLTQQDGSASGVGIQLSWTNTANPEILTSFKEKTGTFALNSSGDYVIPLYARYIRRWSTQPVPGKAEAKVTYTISYI